ncbi:MAG: carbon monoxide dehydrogenase [Pseudonocardiales bacterium]|nr:MAG: carbon monoxide dehydrogenase [Pseudonocardiales bacterium]
MIPASFEYRRPSTVDEAVQALVGGDAKVLAGGQSLLPLLRLRLAFPDLLVDVGRVESMRGVRDDGEHLVIGAVTTHHGVVTDPLIAQHCPLLAQATSTVADPAVRHRGTFGGALSHADPAGDLPAVALALDAEFEIAGPTGRRTVAASEFFVDYLQTAVGAGEVLVSVRVPKLGAGWASHYEKFHRVAQAWAIVGVAAIVRRDGDSIAEARIGLTNMGSTPLRASATESALAGAALHDGGVTAATDRASEGTDPPSDLGGAADYRRHLVKVLTRRAVLAAAGS